jgi:hypothetical protein
MLTIRIKNKNNFVRELLKEHGELSKELVEKVLIRAIQELKATTPVDTGAARDGWYYQFDSIGSFFSLTGVKFEILNEQEYILFVNNGTSTIAPRRFIEQILLRYGVQIGPLAKLE